MKLFFLIFLFFTSCASQAGAYMHEKPEMVISNKFIQASGVEIHLYGDAYLPKVAENIQTEIDNIEFRYLSFDKVKITITFKNTPLEGHQFQPIYEIEEKWKLGTYENQDEYANLYPFISIFFDQNPSGSFSDFNYPAKITNVVFDGKDGNAIVKRDVNRILYLPNSYYQKFNYPQRLEDKYQYFAGHNLLINIPLDEYLHTLEFTIENYELRFYNYDIVSWIPIFLASRRVVIKNYELITDYNYEIQVDLFKHAESNFPFDRTTNESDDRFTYSNGNAVAMIASLGDKIFHGEKLKNIMPPDLNYEGMLLMVNNHKLVLHDGLNVGVKKSDAPIPLAIYDLLKRNEHVLMPAVLEYLLVNNSNKVLSLRIRTELLELSQPDIQNIFLKPHEYKRVKFIPIFTSEAQTLRKPKEYTVASVIKDTSNQILFENTEVVRMLPSDTMLWRMVDDCIGKTQWYDAYVLNWISRFKSKDLDKVLARCLELVYAHALAGYDEAIFKAAFDKKLFSSKKEYTRQIVAAVYQSLNEFNPKYSNEALDFGRASNQIGQRIKYPKETLEQKRGNCIDSTLLFATILEEIGLNPVIVIIRSPDMGHAFLGWETWYDSREFEFLESTFLGYQPFDLAYKQGMQMNDEYSNDPKKDKQKYISKVYVKNLREQGIYSRTN